MGHLKMLAAAQPFISGAISQDHQHARGVDAGGHPAGLHRGLAAGPQGGRDLPRQLQAQPAALDHARTSRRPRAPAAAAAARGAGAPPAPVRRKLPDERQAITHKFSINDHEGYITVGLYDDGQPGEIFLVMAKEGSTISGLMDAFATSISIALQYGVPLQHAGRQVQPHALRALGLHQEPGDPDRQVDHRLHLPLAGLEVPDAARRRRRRG